MPNQPSRLIVSPHLGGPLVAGRRKLAWTRRVPSLAMALVPRSRAWIQRTEALIPALALVSISLARVTVLLALIFMPRILFPGAALIRNIEAVVRVVPD
jgi:hypothetical protein